VRRIGRTVERRIRTVRAWGIWLFAGLTGAALMAVALAAQGQDGTKPPDRQMQAEAHYELGVMYHERVFESLDQAIAEYEKAVKLKPDYAEAHFNLALSYHTKAKLGTDDKVLYRKALAEYKLYLKFSPQGDLAAKAKQNIKAVEARLR
jgi:tetratricopeptide (TPR) repeat protein